MAVVGAQPQAAGEARAAGTATRGTAPLAPAAPIAPAAPTLWSNASPDTTDVPSERSARMPKRGEPVAVGPGRADAVAAAAAAPATAPVVEPAARLAPDQHVVVRQPAPVTPIAIEAAPDSRANRRRSPLPWIAGIAAVLAIAALGAWNVSLQNDMGRLRDYDAAVSDVLAIAKSPGAQTAVLRSDSGDAAVGL